MAKKQLNLSGAKAILSDEKPKLNLSGALEVLKKNESSQPVAPTTSKPLSTGSKPFQTQVDTKVPSVLTEKGAAEYKEQVKNYVPPVQKQPKLPKEKPLSNLESIKNTVYNVANSLKGVLPRLSLTSVDVFEKVIGKDLTGRLTSLPRIEFSSDGIDVVTGRTPEQIRNESLQSLDYLGTKTKPTAGIVENARNFNVPGLAAGVVDAAGGLVSTIIPSALSGGSLLVTEMVGGGLYDYNKAKAKAKGVSTEELYKRGDADFGVPASIGGVGYAMERIGLKGFTNAISKKLVGSGFKKALLLGTEWNKEGLTEWVQVGLDEANLALANGLSVEDAVEAATDKMTSVQGLEAYAKGFAGSAAASGVARAAKRLVSPKNKAKVSELEQQKNQALQDLANDNIAPEAKEAILEVLENTNEQIDDLVNVDIKETENLDENQKVKVSEINSKIEGIDAAIENENTSESTKSILEKKKLELESELDTIIGEVKAPIAPQPRIETEEDIIKEIRAAEKEFNETGDAAEYQLKINDLNQRLENLVPEPEVEGEVIEEEDVEAKKADIERRRQEEIKSITDEVDGMTKEQQEQTAGDRISRRVAANAKYDAELAALEQQIKPQTDAIQEQTAGQVPVQPKAPTGEKVEQGKPEAKPKGVTEEGKEVVSTTVLDKIPRGNTFQERLAPDYYEKLKKDIKENGIKEPIILTYYPKDNALRLSDGHHRLAIAKELGITDIPTKVNVAWSKSIKDNNPDIEGQPIYNAPKTLDIESYRKRDYFPSNVRLDEIGLATKPESVTEEGKKEEVGGEREGDNVKNKQLEIINKTNPAPNDYNTWVRKVEDIKTADEAFSVAKEEGAMYPDFTEQQMQDALDSGEVTVYSSMPIKDGVFVSPSKMNAQEYAGGKGGKLYSKKVKLDDVAWIDEGEGQYASVARTEQTPAQQVEQLRADEQAVLKAAIPNADQYLTDGKVDRDKITDAKDLKKFDEIYDKYDKLISPLLPKKETKAEAPAKAKLLPKAKVATRLAFEKAVNLFYDISAADGSAKKGRLARDRQKFLEQNPSIKYIDDNWKAISEQLESKGLLTKSKGCP